MHETKFMAFSGVLTLLASCSSVGPGFANHPGDCALGILWSDCLPGTRGYANGGGSPNAWANYMQAVNARQPQTVRLDSAHCTSASMGPTVNTSCF
ncbi:hypothetical protein SAMN05444172_8350 [Burkholderia sp. GAS332]|nr:hypothetical protein SAMN05444172_8350 [Burkholderia sp. GAS332]